MKKDRTLILQNVAIITLVLVALYYFNQLFGSHLQVLYQAINSIILPFGIALFISYLLTPLMKLLEQRLKLPYRWVNVGIVILALLAFIALIFFMLGDIIYTQANQFISSDWEAIKIQVETYISNNEFLQSTYDKLVSIIQEQGQDTDIVSVISIFRSIVNIIVTIVLIPVFLVFLLHDRDAIFTGILNVVPSKSKKHVQELGKRANNVIERYFNGKFLSMFILGFLFMIVLKIAGFTWAKSIFFGFTLGFLDIIPYVGGFVGILLPVLFSFTIPQELLFGQYTFIFLLIANMILQFLQGNVIQPLIMGHEVQLHPLLVLVSFIFFGALFGVTGIILAIPITGTIKASAQYYKEVHNG